MDCKQVREHYQPFLDRELGASTAQEVERHLVECDCCAQLVASQRSFNQFIVKAAKAHTRPASDDLRRRVMLQLATDPAATAGPSSNVTPMPARRFSRGMIGSIAIAAGLMMALSAVFYYQANTVPEQCPLVLTAQREHDTVMAGARPLDTATEDPKELAQFISTHLNGKLPCVPNLMDCHLKPVGGGILNGEGEPHGIYLKYVECQCGHQPATLLVIDTSKTPQGESVAINEKKGWAAQQNGRNVVSWKSDDGLLYMLVTEAPFEQAMQLAAVASR